MYTREQNEKWFVDYTARRARRAHEEGIPAPDGLEKESQEFALDFTEKIMSGLASERVSELTDEELQTYRDQQESALGQKMLGLAIKNSQALRKKMKFLLAFQKLIAGS